TGDTPVRAASVVAGLGSAVFSTLAHTTLRALGKEDANAVVFWFQLSIGAGALAALAVTGAPLTTPTASTLPWLVAIGLTALAGQSLMTRAYASDTAPRVAAAGYVGPLLGFALDVAAFGQTPEPASLLGAGFILGAGFWLLR
ncbi:MAG: DMT family transporter, partial [Myxococcales bacterium]|nr:DMT family transporter [Myxococcales bacterium]